MPRLGRSGVAPGYTALYTTTASEDNWIFVPNSWTGGGQRRGIVWCHGAGQGASVGEALGPLAAQLGTVICSPDLSGSPGGLNAFGNDSSLAKVTSQWNVLKSDYGVKTDKVVLMGLSMGTATCLMYALANPANVAAMELELPCFSVDDIHDFDRLGLQSEIDVAYASNWETAKTTRDAHLNHTAWNALDIPMQVHYGGADPVCLPEFVDSFQTNVTNPPIEWLNLGASVGHDITNVDLDERARFLSEHL